jgi:hypothetical protein
VAQRDAVLARQAVGGDGRTGSDERRPVEALEHAPPRREALVAVGGGDVREVGRIVAVGARPGRPAGAVVREQVGKHQRTRPSVEEDVVVGDDEAVVGGAARKDEGHGRWCGEVEGPDARGRGDGGQGAGRRRVHDRNRGRDGVGHHRHHRSARCAHIAAAQHPVVGKQICDRVGQPLHVNTAVEMDDRLGGVDVDRVVVGRQLVLEVEAALQRRERPHRCGRIVPRQCIQIVLRHLGARDVRRAPPDAAGAGGGSDIRQLGDPACTEIGGRPPIENGCVVTEVGDQLAFTAPPRSVDVHGQRIGRTHPSADRRRQFGGIGGGQQVIGMIGVGGRLAHGGGGAEEVEADTRQRTVGQLGIGAVPQEPEAGAGLGLPGQLLLRGLHRVHRVAGRVEQNRRDGGEPADGSRQVGAPVPIGEHGVVTPVALHLNRNRPVVGDPGAALIAADRPGQRGEHHLGTAGAKRPGRRTENRFGDLGRYPDPHPGRPAHRSPSGDGGPSGVGDCGSRLNQYPS